MAQSARGQHALRSVSAPQQGICAVGIAHGQHAPRLESLTGSMPRSGPFYGSSPNHIYYVLVGNKST